MCVYMEEGKIIKSPCCYMKTVSCDKGRVVCDIKNITIHVASRAARHSLSASSGVNKNIHTVTGNVVLTRAL